MAFPAVLAFVTAACVLVLVILATSVGVSTGDANVRAGVKAGAHAILVIAASLIFLVGYRNHCIDDAIRAPWALAQKLSAQIPIPGADDHDHRTADPNTTPAAR